MSNKLEKINYYDLEDYILRQTRINLLTLYQPYLYLKTTPKRDRRQQLIYEAIQEQIIHMMRHVSYSAHQ